MDYRKFRTFRLSAVCLILLCSAAITSAMPYSCPDLAGGDGFVNFADFTALAQNWQKTGTGLGGDLDDSGFVDEIDLLRLAYYWLTEFEWKNADFNSDGIVNLLDFAILADAWLSGAGGAKWNADCDFNGDDVIDITDLDRFVEQWLRQFPDNVIYVDAGAPLGGDGTSQIIKYCRPFGGFQLVYFIKNNDK